MAAYRDDIKAVGMRIDEVLIRRYGIVRFVDDSGSPVGYTEDSGNVVIPKSPWRDEDSSYLDNHVVRTVNDATGKITIVSAEEEIEVTESPSTRTIYIDWIESDDSSSGCPNDPAGGAGVKAE